MNNKIKKCRNYILLIGLGLSIYACNSGSSSSTPANLSLNSGVYKLHYNFESAADILACTLAGYNTSDKTLISNGNGNLCVAVNGQASNDCYNNVNYAYNPCYYASTESANSGGNLITVDEWQNCQFESTGGTALLKYVKFQTFANVPFPFAACGATITLTQESL